MIHVHFRPNSSLSGANARGAIPKPCMVSYRESREEHLLSYPSIYSESRDDLSIV